MYRGCRDKGKPRLGVKTVVNRKCAEASVIGMGFSEPFLVFSDVFGNVMVMNDFEGSR